MSERFLAMNESKRRCFLAQRFFCPLPEFWESIELRFCVHRALEELSEAVGHVEMLLSSPNTVRSSMDIVPSCAHP